MTLFKEYKYKNTCVIFRRKNDDVKFPILNYFQDAGIDLCCEKSFVISSQQQLVVSTGLFIEHFPDDCYGQLLSKSGIVKNKEVEVKGGVIDKGYQGEIFVILKNYSSVSHSFEKGDKICQLVFIKILIPEISCDIERLDQGFGSFDIAKEKNDSETEEFETDYVSMLNLVLQQKKINFPDFNIKMLDKGNKCVFVFTTSLIINNETVLFEGIHVKKKYAKQLICKNILDAL
jgi:dUTP pyrophosphatase